MLLNLRCDLFQFTDRISPTFFIGVRNTSQNEVRLICFI